jgi:hypothetical protein
VEWRVVFVFDIRVEGEVGIDMGVEGEVGIDMGVEGEVVFGMLADVRSGVAYAPLRTEVLVVLG